MLEYIITFFILIVSYVWYTFIFKPKRLYNFYIQTLESLGYRVCKFPFRPFGVPFIERFMNNYKQHNDSFYLDKHQTKKYDIVVHNIMNMVTLDLVNPDMVKQFCSMEKMYLFPKKQAYIANMKRLLGDGVAFSQGDVWKQKRKIITSVFTFDFLKSIIPKIQQICDQELDKVQAKVKLQNPSTDKYELFMLQLGFGIFSSVLMVSFFGMQSEKCKIQNQTPCEFITSALHLVNSQATQPLGYLLGPWIFNLGLNQRDRKVNKIVKTFRQFATKLVKQKIQDIKIKGGNKQNYKDLIEALVFHYHLGNQQQQQNIQQKYSIEDVINQFCTLLAAATDTSSHFMMMLVYYIVQTPQVQKRLRKQIKQTFGENQKLTYEKLKTLKYIDCIQEQVTRIYGPGTGLFLRQAVKDTQILNIPIKKGTTFSIKPILNHYNNQNFDQPLKFKPQRWEHSNNIHPYTIMGFGGGPRSCLGKQLAMLQTKIALVKLFQRYSSIQLQTHINQWKMQAKFLYTPQKFMTILKR